MNFVPLFSHPLMYMLVPFLGEGETNVRQEAEDKGET